VLRIAVSSLWIHAVSLLLAIIPAAVYASVINDLTDRADDVAAGKRNRATKWSYAVLVITIGAGCGFAWLWRDDVRLVSCYAATWLAFTLYSLPPFRFKSRGVAGVLCDAAGAHLFPALVAVFIAPQEVSAAWALSVGAWAFAYGLRGILWHQLTDVENDRAADVHTFARRHPSFAARVGTFVIFPIELAALASMLRQIRSALPPAFLALYVLYAIWSARRWKTSPVIVAPKPRYFIVLHQFYSDLFPIALLIAASARDRRDLWILGAHIVLFPRRALHLLRVSASTAKTVVNASDPHHGGFG